MKKTTLLLLIIIMGFLNVYSQEYLNWEEHSVDEFYEKTDLPSGTLDEDGDDIDFVFIITTIKEGVYEIEITNGKGDLYEINGTDYFIEFRGHYGYAGYADEGVLVVGGFSWSSTFYEKDE